MVIAVTSKAVKKKYTLVDFFPSPNKKRIISYIIPQKEQNPRYLPRLRVPSTLLGELVRLFARAPSCGMCVNCRTPFGLLLALLVPTPHTHHVLHLIERLTLLPETTQTGNKGVIISIFKPRSWDWKDGLAVESSGSSLKGPRLKPQHTRWLTVTYNSSLRRSDVFFWPPRAPGTHMVHSHIYRQNTHTDGIKIRK